MLIRLNEINQISVTEWAEKIENTESKHYTSKYTSVKVEVWTEIKVYYEPNENENISYQNLWDVVNTCLVGNL